MKTLVFLVFFIVLLAVGYFSPSLVIPSKLSDYSGEERIVVNNAFSKAKSFVGGSTEPFIVTAYSVKQIRRSNLGENEHVNCSEITGEKGISITHHYEAQIQIYTFFGLPYATFTVTDCQGASINRVIDSLLPSSNFAF